MLDDIEYKKTLLPLLLVGLSDRTTLDSALGLLGYSINAVGIFGQVSNSENYSKLIDDFVSEGLRELLAFAAICQTPTIAEAGEFREKLLSPCQSAAVELFIVLNDGRIPADVVASTISRIKSEQKKIWDERRYKSKLTKLVAVYELCTNSEAHGVDYISPFVEEVISKVQLPATLALRLRIAESDINSRAELSPTEFRVQGLASGELQHVLISIEEMPTPSAKVVWDINVYRCVPSGVPQSIDSLRAELTEVEIPKYLSKLRNTLADDAIGVDRVVLHFFVPPKMLAKPIDQWCFTLVEGLDIKCGEEFCVVVRLWDSKFKGREERLKSRWSWLKQSSGMPDEERFLFFPRKSERGFAYKEFMKNDKLQCVIVDAAVTVTDDPESIPCLLEGFFAGIPVMMWARDDACAPVLVEEVKQWLQSSLSMLPDTLRKYRLGASTTANGAGNHVTLMFEDVDRNLPPNSRLKPSRP